MPQKKHIIKKNENTRNYGEIFLKLVPDTSVVIDGRITGLIDNGEYNGAQIIIPEAVVAELESQANQGREIGFSGLTELQELCKLAEQGVISIEFVGERPTLQQVKLASGGEIDAMIRKVAIENKAKFITSDMVQSEVARAKGLDVLYLKPQVEDFTPLAIDQFFDEYTIAIYLKERAKPFARKGSIQKSETVVIREALCTEYELRSIAQEILERAKRDPDGFIEIEKRGVTVVQIGSMRISITRRPFSDGMEITAVRPIVDLSLDDYEQASEIKKLLTAKKPGILITGTPGCGKTTLAQAIATYLNDSGSIVKTMERPREMLVPDQITQYTALDGSMVNTRDVLLLVRPDFVIFDELRKDEDFEVFADMRLAGIGMIGIIHAVSPHEALQRFADRVDFSALAQIFGSMIYVQNGKIEQICTTSFAMKKPEGIDDDHIRPVTTLSDHFTGQPLFDIFKHGSETIVLPIEETEEDEREEINQEYIPPAQVGSIVEKNTPVSPERYTEDDESEEPDDEPESYGDENSAWSLTERDIQHEIGRYTNGEVIVEMLSASKAIVYIDDRDVPAAIGKGGKNIAAIVNKVGVGIDIRPGSELIKKGRVLNQVTPEREELNLGEGLQVRIDKKQLSIISPDNTGKIVDVFAGREYLFTATVNDDGEIHLAKSSTIAQEMLRRYNEGEPIRLKTV